MITKNLIIYGLAFVAGCLIMVYNFLPASIPEASAADSVSVTATITSSVTCGTDTQTTGFSTLALLSITNSSPDITATTSCNYAAGCNLKIYDAGNGTNPGLASTTQPTVIIGSANDSWADTATLAAGTEGYGIWAATSTAGTGGTLTVMPRYNRYLLATSTGAVGGLKYGSGAAIQIASSTEPVSSRAIIVTHRAAISGLSQAGVYADTITYSCLAN